MTARFRKLRMEQMEAREMMAGDVTAYLQYGNLYINEATGQAGLDNGVRVSQLSNGQIRVTGTEGNNSSTSKSLVNGAAYKDFSVTGSLYVNLGGGNDRVQLGYDGGTSAPSFNDVNINVAAPPPMVQKYVIGGTTTTYSAPDADQVFIWGAYTRGAMNITTGADHDWVSIGPVTIGTDLVINSGAGADEVDLKGALICRNLDLQTYSSLAENDADVVFIDAQVNGLNPSLTRTTTVNGYANIRMGGGNDILDCTDPNYTDAQVTWLGFNTLGALTVDMGTGNDSAFLRSFQVGGDSGIYTGAGADTVNMRHASLTGNILIQTYATYTEADADSVSLVNFCSAGLTVLTGYGDDVLTLSNVCADKGSVYIDTSAGNDQVTADLVTALDNFYANLGDGNDSLTLTNLWSPTATLLGGDGFDTLVRWGGRTDVALQQLGWEMINGRFNVVTGGSAAL
jgi:hypothetical protein